MYAQLKNASYIFYRHGNVDHTISYGTDQSDHEVVSPLYDAIPDCDTSPAQVSATKGTV